MGVCSWPGVLKWGLASAISLAVADLLGQQVTEHTPFYENGKQRRTGGSSTICQIAKGMNSLQWDLQVTHPT